MIIKGMARVNYIGIIASIVTFTSLLLPWWSIRASGVSIDVYPFGVKALNIPTYDSDWVVSRILALDGTLLFITLLGVISGVLAVVGSLKLRPLLAAPTALNLVAAFLFYRLMHSTLGRLALSYSSGTNLIPVPGEPWGFVWGIGLCALAGLVSPTPLILFYWKRYK